MEMIGIDGCQGGWALAVRTAGERRVRFYVMRTLDCVFAAARAERATVAIDMPIGLPNGEPRVCDGKARELLRDRHSSVFSVPCRKAVLATTRREARRLNRRTLGRGITRQAFGIFGKMRHVDRLIRPKLQDRVFETHPEVVFAVLNGGRAMAAHKARPHGRSERLAVLAKRGVRFDPAAERRWLDPARVCEDDLVDAAACLLAAERKARGKARAFAPDGPPQTDARHLRMEIWG